MVKADHSLVGRKTRLDRTRGTGLLIPGVEGLILRASLGRFWGSDRGQTGASGGLRSVP